MISRGPFWPPWLCDGVKICSLKDCAQFYMLQRFILEASCSLWSSDTPELLGLLNKQGFWLGASQKSFLPEHFAISYTQWCAVQHSPKCKKPCAIILFVLGEKHPDSNPLKWKWTVKKKKKKKKSFKKCRVYQNLCDKPKVNVGVLPGRPNSLSGQTLCAARFLRRLNQTLQLTPPN